MADYVEFDGPTPDPDELAQEAIARLEIRFPGWEPNEAHLEVAVIEEVTAAAAESAAVARSVAAAIFRTFGQKLIDIQPIDGSEATAEFTFTMIDDAGYTVPEGTVFAYRTEAGDYWLFETTAEAEVLNGDTEAVGVPAQAQDIGEDRNGIALGTTFELIDSLVFVESIVSDTATAGGSDAETDEEYLNRLADELVLVAPRPILPQDFAKLARRVEGVHRAVAVDGYDPDTDTDDNERTVAVSAVDSDGAAVGAGIQADLIDFLDAMREVNFVVKWLDPEYNEVDIVFEAVAVSGYDPASVEADAEAAVVAYIDPGSWAGGDLDPPEWQTRTVLRFLEVAEVINRVSGIDYVTLLTINGVAADLALDGRAPLPSALGAGAGSSVGGTVVAP